jgi:hypothetical protein
LAECMKHSPPILSRSISLASKTAFAEWPSSRPCHSARRNLFTQRDFLGSIGEVFGFSIGTRIHPTE